MEIRAWLRAIMWLAASVVSIDSGFAAGVRLAVWASPERQDLAALLMVELSGEYSGYELLGRDDLARAMAEQAGVGVDAQSAARVGRLLGATGVAWLGEVRDGGATRLVLRLSAVESGLVVGWRIDEAEQLDAARWAAKAARELEGWRPKLAVGRGAARAVSLLNLRGAGGADARDERGRVYTILLGQALARAPRLWVTERWRLNDLALESVLGGEVVDEFWSGAAVVDGSFTELGGDIALTMRLRRPGAEEERWTTTHSDAGELVSLVADEVARRLGGDAFTKAWDRGAEAREFLDEARWAARRNLHELAFEAIEAAITLGEQGPEARRLQYLVHGRRIWGMGAGPHFAPVRRASTAPWSLTQKPPAREKLEAAREVLARFTELRATRAGHAHLTTQAGLSRNSPMMNERPLTLAESDAVELLNGVASLLRAGYFSRGADAETEAALADLRREARAFFDRELGALGVVTLPRETGANTRSMSASRGRPGHPEMPLNTLFLTGFAQGALWTERLSEHQDFARQLMEREIEGEPNFYWDALRLLHPVRMEAWQVDWATRNPREARASWDRVGREWIKSPDLGLAMAGAFQLLALNPPFPMPSEMSGGMAPSAEMPKGMAEFVSSFGPPEENESRVVLALGFFAKNVEAFASGTLPAEQVENALRMVPGGVPGAVRDAWAESLASWWEKGDGEPRGEAVFMSGIVRYTPEQQARLQAARSRTAGVRKVESSAAVLPPLKMPGVRQEKLELTRMWIVPEARARDEGNAGGYAHRPSIRWLDRREGRVRVISEEAGVRPLEKRMRLTEIDLATFREREVGAWTIKDSARPDRHLFPAHALLGRWVFSVEKDGLRRRDPITGEEREIVLPVRLDGPIWVVDEHLYATWSEGGIVRVEPDSGAWEILADSRRRPARGELDDRVFYRVSRIWRGADGGLRARLSLDGQAFVYDEAKLLWSKEEKGSKGSQAGGVYDRGEYLERMREAELASQGHGARELSQLLEDLDRSGKYKQTLQEVALVHLLGTHRPPAGYLQRQVVVFHPFGGTVKGGEVWALLHCAPHEDWSPRLVWLPRPGKEIVAVELGMPAEWMSYMTKSHRQLGHAGLGGEHARLSVGPEGLVFYAMNGAAWWLVPASELAAVGVEVVAE